jgi:hypothetical protein
LFMKLEYSPLSSIQIHDFLERNNIDALDIKEIGNYTVIELGLASHKGLALPRIDNLQILIT